MTECSLSWWQTEQSVTLLIFILSALFGVIGWFFKTWWEGRKPYKRDREIFEEIKKYIEGEKYGYFYALAFSQIFDGFDKEAYTNAYLSISQAGLSKYFFINKQLEKHWNKLINKILDMNNYINQNFKYTKNDYTPWQFKDISLKNEYDKKVEKLSNSYDDFIKIATKELYKERVN